MCWVPEYNRCWIVARKRDRCRAAPRNSIKCLNKHGAGTINTKTRIRKRVCSDLDRTRRIGGVGQIFWPTSVPNVDYLITALVDDAIVNDRIVFRIAGRYYVWHMNLAAVGVPAPVSLNNRSIVADMDSLGLECCHPIGTDGLDRYAFLAGTEILHFYDVGRCEQMNASGQIRR